MLRNLLIKYKYTSDSYAELRRVTSFKYIYKQKLHFLSKRINLSNSVSNRLVYSSNCYRSYLNIRRYYINILRANFCKKLTLQHKPYFFTESDIKPFLLIYSQKQSIKEFDYLLYWKANQYNSMFNLTTSIKKKKKKYIYKQTVYFIKPEKRILFVWKWLSVFIRCVQVKGVPREYSLIKGLDNFLFSTPNNDVINQFKLKIYKMKLLRVV